MSAPGELAVLSGVILDAGLKATLVMGAASALSLLLGRSGAWASASVRHAVWAASLGCLPVLPWMAHRRGALIAVDAPWVFQLWAVGAALAAVPLLLGLLRLAWLRREATPGPGGVLYHPRLAGPVTWGLLRPVVLLPAAARDWAGPIRDAALAHERAHIARRDWPVHIAAWCVCVLFWFHPAVWLARRRLAQEAEHAADDAVLAQGVRPSDYASLLVGLAQGGQPRVALGVARSPVGQRVQAVLGTRSRGSRRWPIWLLALLLAGLSLPALGAWPTWTAPQDTLTCQ